MRENPEKASGFEVLDKSASIRKRALIERLVRLGATDIPGTPRLLMRRRTPQELGSLQHAVEVKIIKPEADRRGFVNVHEKTAASVDELVSGSGRLKNVEVVPMPTSPTSAAGGRSLPNGTIIVPPEGSYESLQKKLQVLGRPQLPALSRDGERAFNAQVLLHEQMERNRRHVGESWQRHRPGVLLDEHNMLARMTGPGSEEVRSLVTQLRNTPRPNTPMADIPAVTQLMERLGVKGFQYGHGQRIPKAMKKQLITMMKSAEKAEDGEHDLQGHIDFQGLHIAVENRKGSVRSGTTPDGHKWRTVMKAPYGYIEAPAKGKDGESIDVYVGPKKDADTAFVVHQHKPDGTGHDEDKVILGVEDEAAAKKLYLQHYDDPKFLGPISTIPVEKLREIVEENKRIAKLTEKSAAAPQPGDILLSRMSTKKYPVLGRLSPVIGLVQGSDVQHAAIYAGNDQVVHAWPGRGVVSDPLKDFQEHNDAEVYRVKASPAERKDAAQFARKAVGRGYSYYDFIRAAAPDLADKQEEKLTARDKHDFICSGLVAAAYPKKEFGGRAASVVRPVDFERSPLTKKVAEAYMKKYVGVHVKVPTDMTSHVDPDAARHRAQKFGRTHHVTLLTPDEISRLKKKGHEPAYIKQVFDSVPTATMTIKRDPVVFDTPRRVYDVLKVDWPDAQRAREQLGLRPSNLHVTVGATEKKIEDVQYNMKFPKVEHKELQGRLEQNKPIFTTRTENERGKYIPGMTVKTPWGEKLRVVDVQPVKKVQDHPFHEELSPQQRSQLAGRRMDVVKLEKVADMLLGLVRSRRAS